MEFLAGIKGLDLICEFFIKSSAILTSTFILVYLFRKKSSSLRHFLLSVSLISLLLLPFFTSISKGWETGLIPTWQTEESRYQLSERSDQTEKSSLLYEASSIPSAEQQLFALNLEKNGRFDSILSKYSLSRGFIGIAIMAIWSAGLIVLLSRIIIGLFGVHRLTRQGQKISASSWRQLLNHFLKSISIKRKIGLFSHKNVNIPLTWGVIKPVVILPTESKNWTQDQRSSALFHELSHIKRGDFLVKILARCSLALYWFNPLSWFAFRMMKKEQEKACDELVLKAGVKPSTYAVNLLSIKNAGQFQWSPPSAALGAVGKSQLNERLIAILKQQLNPKEVNMKTKILLSTLIIMTIAFIGLARPSQSEAYTDIVLSPENTAFAHNLDAIQETTDQEKQVKKTIVKTDKKESEDQTKKTITWVSADGKKIELIISTDEKGETKISKVEGDKLIEIEKDPDGNSFTLLIDDKNLVLHEEEGGHWSLHSDDKDALQYQLSTSHEHDKQYSVVYMKKGDKDDKNVFYVKADKIQVEKGEKPYKIVNIHVTPNIKIPSKEIDIYISGEEGEKKKIKVAPYVNVHMAPDITRYSLQHSETDQKELKEKLAEITEKLKEIRENNKLELNKESREEALKEVEEMVKKLSEELKKKSVELKDISLSLHTDLEDLHFDKAENVVVDIKDIHLDRAKKIDEIKWIEKKDADVDIAFDIKEGKNIAFVSHDEGEFMVKVMAHFDSESKSKYEAIVNKLKKDLPEGYTIESIVDEDTESITISITGNKEDKKTEKKIKEILADIEKQLSEIKK